MGQYERVIRSMKKGVSQARGFIEANAYSLLDDNSHRWLVVHFDCLQNWQRWHDSEERKRLLDAMHPLLLFEETVTILQKHQK